MRGAELIALFFGTAKMADAGKLDEPRPLCRRLGRMRRRREYSGTAEAHKPDAPAREPPIPSLARRACVCSALANGTVVG
jgi:hypothetical protein